MAIVELNAPQQILLDLRGEQGNAFIVLGMATKLGKMLGFSDEEQEFVNKKMKEKDYEHLVHVFEHYFGDFVQIVLPEAMKKTWDPNYCIFEEGMQNLFLDNPDSTEVSIVRRTKTKI